MTYFMHRIQRTGNTFQKGIEVHEDLDSAKLAFWGRMKLGYNKTDCNFVSCKITDSSGNVVDRYDMTWKKNDDLTDNKFFLHHIRKDGNDYDKNIDILDTVDAAYGNFATEMEYGYNNPTKPNVTYVSCEITDMSGANLMAEAWEKPTPQPEPEPIAE